MEKITFIAIILLLGFHIEASEIKHKITNGVAPNNNLWIDVNDKISGGITKDQFNKVIDDVNSVYEPIFKSLNCRLVFERNWDDGTVNASTDRDRTTCNVYMYGGLARYATITPDAFTYAICHEIGHHLGGAPKDDFGLWASVEGQADYFAGLKCLKKIWGHDDNVLLMGQRTIDPIAVSACEKRYSNSSDIALCKRLTQAGKILASILANIKGESEVSFSSPSQVVVQETMADHPPSQCRLDTFLAAALCNKNPDENFSDENSRIGACNQGSDSFGFRPRCWYKP